MKTSHKIGLILLVALSFLLASCDKRETNKEALKDSGLFGEHMVGAFKQENSETGLLNGHYFLFGGTITVNATQDTNISFSWSPKENHFVTTSIPRRKFVTILDETQTTPSVVFVYTEDWLNAWTPFLSEPHADYGNGGPYPTTTLNNVNAFLENCDELVQVEVHINSADLANEPLLPGPSR